MDELRKKIEGAFAEIEGVRAKTVTEKRDLTVEEEAGITAKLDLIEDTNKRIAAVQREVDLRAKLTKPTAGAAFSDVHMGADREAERPFNTMGEQLRAIAQASRPGGHIDKRLLYLNETESRTAVAGGGSETGDAGFLVQTDFAAELLKRTYNNSAVAGLCTRRTLSSGANSIELNAVDEQSRADGSRFGGVRAYWGYELGGTTASAPKFGKIKLDLKDLYALYYASDQVLEDAAMLEAEVMDMFSQEMAFKLQNALINGTGAGDPLGILTCAALVSATAVTGQKATTLNYENIIAMWSRCYGPSRGNAVWFVNQDIEPQLFTMSLAVGTGGAPVYIPAGGASASPYGTLFGRPVIPIEQCQTLGTVGDIILADMSQYIIAEKGGVTGASSIHFKFTDWQTTFRWHLRVDGQPRWKTALAPFKGSNTLSPFVALATRA